MLWNKTTKSLGKSWDKGQSLKVSKEIFLSQEDGFEILQEDGFGILAEDEMGYWTKIIKSSGKVWNKISKASIEIFKIIFNQSGVKFNQKGITFNSQLR